jgi:hypothetical protein
LTTHKGVIIPQLEPVVEINYRFIFVEHMMEVGFNNSFIHSVLSEEEDNNLGSPTHNASDLETILSTNEFHKKKGKGPNEKSAQSPIITPKTTTSRSSAPMTHPSGNVTISSSGD